MVRFRHAVLTLILLVSVLLSATVVNAVQRPVLPDAERLQPDQSAQEVLFDAFNRQGIFPRDVQKQSANWQLETRFPRSYISSIAWHPDGKFLAVSEYSGCIRIYEASSWKLANVIYCPGGEVQSIAHSPDGKWLASTSTQQPLRIWKADGTLVAESSINSDVQSTIAWSPDSQRIAMTANYRDILIFDLTGKQLQRIKGHTETITSIAWSPSGNHLTSTSHEGTACLWDLANARPRRDRGGPEEGDIPEERIDQRPDDIIVPSKLISCNEIVDLKWGPSGDTFAVAARTGVVRVYDVDGTLKNTVQAQPDLRGIDWDSTGNTLTTFNSKMVEQISVADGNRQIVSELDHVRQISSHPETKQLAINNRHGVTILNFEDESSYLIPRMDYGGPGSQSITRTVIWSPNGKTFTCPTRDCWVRFWNADGLGVETNWKIPGEHIWSMSLSPDDKWLVTHAFGKGVRFWKTDGTAGPAFTDLPARYLPTWSPDGKFLATPDMFGSIQLINQRGEFLSKHLHELRPGDIFKWSPHSDVLAICKVSEAGEIKLMDTEGRIVKTMEGTVNRLSALDWHPLSHRLVTVSQEGNVRDWNADGSRGTLKGHHEHQGSDVAWSPDGQLIASAGKNIKIWNSSGELENTLQHKHNALIEQLQWHPDGTWIAARLSTDAIQLWNRTGEEALELAGNSLHARSMAWNPDGSLIACTATTDSIIIWDAKSGLTLWLGIELADGNSAVVDSSGKLLIDDEDIEAFDKKYVFVEFVDGKNVLKTSAK